VIVYGLDERGVGVRVIITSPRLILGPTQNLKLTTHPEVVLRYPINLGIVLN
jgi:hypothetical protein